MIGFIDTMTDELAPKCRACPAAQRAGVPDSPMVMHREFGRTANGTEIVVFLPVSAGGAFLCGCGSWFGRAFAYRTDRTGD